MSADESSLIEAALTDAPHTAGQRLFRVILPRAIAVLVVIGAGLLIYSKRRGIGDAIHDAGIWPVLASLALAVIGTAAIQRVWASVLRGLGVELDGRDAATVFFISQLGKYVPGSVWPILAQVEFGRRARVPRRLMVTANLLMLAIVTATGLFAGAILLPWSSGDGLRRYWWTLLLLVPLIVSLLPRFLTLLLNRAFLLIRQPPLQTDVRPRAILIAVGWGLLVWLVLGAHLLVLTRALGATGADATLAAVGGMGLAFAAGLIVIPVPAGGGIRDAILIAVFSADIGSTDAVAVALASRVLLIVADVLLAAGAAASRSWFAHRAKTVRSSVAGQ